MEIITSDGGFAFKVGEAGRTQGRKADNEGDEGEPEEGITDDETVAVKQ